MEQQQPSPLDLSDTRHLEAANGWLGLGSWKDAHEELDHITPDLRHHPSVLRTRYEIFAAAKNWESALQTARSIASAEPNSAFGPVHMAYALHEMKRTREALDILLPVSATYPHDPLIPYNLACYCCQLDRKAEALLWLFKAFNLAKDKRQIRIMARGDADLAPIWSQIPDS
jgi:predicted Zn-dependent protease